jgi:CO dehydrogenase flavoprotein C-terminal domain/[2Fe-2S] binding domain
MLDYTAPSTVEEAVRILAEAPGAAKVLLSPGEFIVAFHLPKRPPRSADAYLRFIPRTEMDIAVVGAAVSLTLDAGGVCSDARVVLGAVAPTAILLSEAAAVARGHDLHPLQQKFLEHAALQCGFCTPGLLVARPFRVNQSFLCSEPEAAAGVADQSEGGTIGIRMRIEVDHAERCLTSRMGTGDGTKDRKSNSVITPDRKGSAASRVQLGIELLDFDNCLIG